MSELVKAIVENVSVLKDVILYFSTGYIFLSVYDYVTLTPKEEQSDHLIIKCIIFSCVFSIIFDILKVTLLSQCDSRFQVACIVLLALISGLIIGFIRRSTIVSNFIDNTVGGSPSEDLRIDIREELKNKDLKGIRIRTKTKGEVYQGQVRRISGSSENPVFMISSCEKIDLDEQGKKVIKQYGHDELMLFSFSDLDFVRILDIKTES